MDPNWLNAVALACRPAGGVGVKSALACADV